jgi:hypothetical protein
VNGDGAVTLDEYLGAYVDIVEKLNDGLSDICKKLIEHKRQRDENLEKLDLARVTRTLALTSLSYSKQRK